MILDDSSGHGQAARGRIVLISEDLTPPLDEGIKKATVALVNAMRRQVRSLLVATRSPLPLDGIQHASLPGNKLLLSLAMAKALRRFAPDALIYIPTSSATTASFLRSAVLRSLAGGVKTALVALQPRRYSVVAHALVRRIAPDVVFAQSYASVSALRALGCPARWLPGGVDSTTFTPVSAAKRSSLRSRFGFTDSDRVVLHVGHLKRERNLAVLARLCGEGYQVVIVGSTSTAHDHALRSELQRAGAHVFGDYIQRIEEFYQLADCYVFPVVSPLSAVEVPLSVLEAMACNLPVVTTPFGGLPSMLKEGHGLRFLRDENDLPALVHAVLAHDQCETRAKVATYSWSALARRLIDVVSGANP